MTVICAGMAGDGKIYGRESRSWYKGREDGGVSGRESGTGTGMERAGADIRAGKL
ncbi:hypothetical protein ACTQZS_10690 [Bilifractor sp. LCP19S3_H10]|uniref:hypothetical protein n=1 Tax=Bilifractor sp. LCP19S3_H10 TaxID=3438736 RepID=UPI003F91F6B4